MSSNDILIKELYNSGESVPEEAIRKLIELCPSDAGVEDSLLKILERYVREEDGESAEYGFEVCWAMVILARAKSDKALDLFIGCLGKDSDNALEMASQALIWNKGPAAKRVMEWLENNGSLSWTQRLYGYGVLEEAGYWADDDFVREVKEFFKKGVLYEERLPHEDSCMLPLLTDLAILGRKDVLPFVRSVALRYEWCPDLEEAYDIADGRFKFDKNPRVDYSWEDVCRDQMSFIGYGKKTKREKELEQKRLFKEVKKACKYGKWENAIEKAAKLKKECPEMRFSASKMIISSCLNMKDKVRLREETERSIHEFSRRWDVFPDMEKYEDMDFFLAMRSMGVLFKEIDRAREASLKEPSGEGKNVTAGGVKVECDDGHGFYPLTRYGDLFEGLLQNIGCIDLAAGFSAINKLVTVIGLIKKEYVEKSLKKDPRFKFHDRYIALAEVYDVEKLVDEHKKRKWSVRLPRTLSEIKLGQEKRDHVMYSREERVLDFDIRVYTNGAWDLGKVRRELKKDIEGFIGAEMLIDELKMYHEFFEYLQDVIGEVWNTSSRWELKGLSPEEAKERILE